MPRQGHPRKKQFLIWLSDVHADILGYSLEKDYRRLARTRPAGVLVTGDLASARMLKEELELLSSSFHCPVYLVLGNHDFYGSSLKEVRTAVNAICAAKKNLVYLEESPTWLSKGTVLIGCDGWGDGRAGAGVRTNLAINDRSHISDFIGTKKASYFRALRELGRASATKFLDSTASVVARANHVIIATHVPPLVPCLLPRLDLPDYAPHYINMALGRAILRVARQNPRVKFSLYCGHAHRETTYSPVPNLSISVAGASYYDFRPAGRIRTT